MSNRDRTIACSTCGITFLDTARAQPGPGEPPGSARAPQQCPGCRALERLTARRRGTVRWFDVRKGYGFVRDAQGHEAFLHRSELPLGRRVRAGTPIEYEAHDTERGPVARRVTVLDDSVQGAS